MYLFCSISIFLDHWWWIQENASFTLILGVVHVPLLPISNYLFNCIGASTCDYRGDTLARFINWLFKCVVEIAFDLRGCTCTTSTKVVNINCVSETQLVGTCTTVVPFEFSCYRWCFQDIWTIPSIRGVLHGSLCSLIRFWDFRLFRTKYQGWYMYHSFFRCKCPISDHCDKHLCFQKGCICTTLAHFQVYVKFLISKHLW